MNLQQVRINLVIVQESALEAAHCAIHARRALESGDRAALDQNLLACLQQLTPALAQLRQAFISVDKIPQIVTGQAAQNVLKMPPQNGAQTPHGQ